MYPFTPDKTQVVAISSSSVQSTALSDGLKQIYLVATSACHVALGDVPVATTSDMFIPANEPLLLNVAVITKIAVIQNSASGNLYITEAH